ncbi:hypothetical protein J7K55_01495 [Candidatus Aerophobetes bacterium]|nr:hypothetical protein [Candidatus Aerophobetes bacterium]
MKKRRICKHLSEFVDTEENGKINNIVQTFELYFSLNRVSIPTRYPNDL